MGSPQRADSLVHQGVVEVIARGTANGFQLSRSLVRRNLDDLWSLTFQSIVPILPALEARPSEPLSPPHGVPTSYIPYQSARW